jgi:hypothetical protein
MKFGEIPSVFSVIPAKAGIQGLSWKLRESDAKSNVHGFPLKTRGNDEV